MFRIVAATRSDRPTFLAESLLGRSLERVVNRESVELSVYFENTLGLPELYNASLDQADDEDVLIFVHDDVWIDDWFLPERLQQGLERFAVVGVAGNRRRVPKQPGWWTTDTSTQLNDYDLANLSGSIAHFDGPVARVIYWGEVPSPVKLLDGVFLAARAGTLRQAGVRFDPRFKFHYYDMDFCRQCEQAGLTMGTWPIALTHGSGGQLTDQWRAVYLEYLEKWRE
ncbi:MAG TPA: glycosyltransferase [Gemmataceae bacterium]|jgi:glycosyltransferase involved in cell wall biosynthesis|nr:glycosyltransferase [Gemmataceae bacterium]